MSTTEDTTHLTAAADAPARSCCSTTAKATPVAPVVAAGASDIRITVKGGYSPSHIVLTKGVPARLVFVREETSGCSEELLIPELGIRRRLPAFAETVIDVTPLESGDFAFTCGMRMLRGHLEVR